MPKSEPDELEMMNAGPEDDEYKRLRTRDGFKVTGVQLYPHWNARRDGNGCE